MERTVVIMMEEFTGKRSVMTPDCDLYVAGKDTITWDNYTDTDFTVHFDDKENPIDTNDIKVPARPEGEPFGKAGPFKLNFKVVSGLQGKKMFYYDLLVPAASSVMAADPIVIVHGS